MGDIAILLREIRKALPEYERAELYSRGRVKEVWANPRIAKVLGRSAGKYPVNIARRPITAILNRLEIQGITVESADEGESERLTKALIDQVYKPNNMELELPDAFDRTETYGDSYLICWPNEDDESKADVIGNDPKYVRVIYDPERPRKILFSGRTWLNSDGFRRVTIWRDGPVRERYISKSTEDAYPAEDYRDTDFVPFLDDEEDGESWREDLAMGLGNPVFHLRTADHGGYGVPMHESVYGTQNMLTKQIATMMDATDGYAFPLRYQLVKAGTTGNIASLDDDWDEDDSDTPKAPTGQRVNPGEIAKFWDTEAIGQLEPANVGNFLQPMEMTLRLSSTVSNTPLNYFDPSAASASGESKKEQDKPLVATASNQKMRLDGTIRAALKYALELLGYDVPGVVVNWAPVESVDEAAEMDLAAKRKDVGVPLKEVLVAAGYAERDVERWIEEATPDDEVLEHRITLLKELAQAAQALGAAASLGVIEPGAASQLIARFITTNPEIPPLPAPSDPPEPQPNEE